MDPDFARQYYESASADHWWFQGRRQLVREVLSSREVATGVFLDLGAGAESLLPDSLTVIKLDVVRPDSVAGWFVQGSAELLPFQRDTADGVGLFDVLEHLSEPERCLAEVGRVVRPGGSVLVTVPAHQWLWSPHDDLVGHKRRYTRETLETQLVAAGLEVQWISGFYRFLVAPAVVRRVFSLQSPMTMPGPGLNRLLVGLATRSVRRALRRSTDWGLSFAAMATVV